VGDRRGARGFRPDRIDASRHGEYDRCVVSGAGHGLVMVAVLACACCGSGSAAGDTERSTSTTTSMSSNATSASATAVTAATASSDAEGLMPDAGSLPEGCGDGVVEPGQYCYLPVEVPGVSSIRQSIAVDLDEDGRDEFVLDAWTEGEVVHVAYDGDAFIELARVPGAGGGNFYEWDTQYDVDGDGRRDVLGLNDFGGEGNISWYPNEEGRLGERWLEALVPFSNPYDVSAFGVPAPVDIDLDGVPEFVQGLYSQEFDVPYQTAQLFRRVAEHYEPDGPPDAGWMLFGCHHLWHHAKADFDEDGHEDVAIVEYSTACDPYPPEYNPDWHRFMLFLSRPASASLELLGTFPTGAVQDGRVWARDIDADGHADLLIDTQASASSGSGLTFHRGKGDGTFEVPITVNELTGVGALGVDGVGQFDDDAPSEIIVGVADGLGVLASPDPDADYAVVRPFVEGTYAGVRAIGDVNGDGLDDILIQEDQAELGDHLLVLVSVP
jgi:hypothetical protein